MKKYFLSVLLLLTLLFTSCSSITGDDNNMTDNSENNEPKYKVYFEESAPMFGLSESDLTNTAEKINQSSEIRNYVRDGAQQTLQLELNGTSYSVNYLESSVLYGTYSYIDYYTEINNTDLVFGVDQNTGKIVFFNDKSYMKSNDEYDNDTVLSEEFLVKKASEILSQHIDCLSEYTLTSCDSVTHTNKLYMVEFSRFISGVKTADKLIVYIRPSGQLNGFNIVNMGRMDESKFPSEDDMLLIREEVEKKAKETFENYTERYDYRIFDVECVRLNDDEYAMLFHFEYKFIQLGADTTAWDDGTSEFMWLYIAPFVVYF